MLLLKEDSQEKSLKELNLSGFPFICKLLA